MKKISYIILLFIAACAAVINLNTSGCSASSNAVTNADLEAEKLQAVVTNPALEEYIVHYKGMTVSFNPRLHIPNWVAWELTADEAQGEEPRYDTFSADESVPGSADPWDYKYTGYDRGHICPAGDLRWDPEAMKESFYMTNMCPQTPDFNRGTWQKLENKCRQRAMADSAIIIIAGPVLTDEIKEYLGDNKVAVPNRFFKVVLSPFREEPVAIGFLMNNGKVEGGMQGAAVTVDEVEAITGHDFFSALPDDVENKVEAYKNFTRWSQMK